MPNIDEFKAALIGGGARANQFRVTITEPIGIAVGLVLGRTSLLCSAANLPAMSLPNIAIPFRGRTINIAGIENLLMLGQLLSITIRIL